jgi:hypothetical protein
MISAGMHDHDAVLNERALNPIWRFDSGQV